MFHRFCFRDEGVWGLGVNTRAIGFRRFGTRVPSVVVTNGAK